MALNQLRRLPTILTALLYESALILNKIYIINAKASQVIRLVIWCKLAIVQKLLTTTFKNILLALMKINGKNKLNSFYQTKSIEHL